MTDQNQPNNPPASPDVSDLIANAPSEPANPTASSSGDDLVGYATIRDKLPEVTRRYVDGLVKEHGAAVARKVAEGLAAQVQSNGAPEGRAATAAPNPGGFKPRSRREYQRLQRDAARGDQAAANIIRRLRQDRDFDVSNLAWD